MPKRDVSQVAIRQLREVTRTGVTRGEDMTNDPALARKFREAKAAMLTQATGQKSPGHR